MGVRNWVIATAGLIGLGTAVSAFIDDGIEGCLEIDGRAHFQMDDGSISEEPIRALQFSDDGQSCYVSHGGNTPPDVYPLLNSDFAAAQLAEAAVDYSPEEWAELDATYAENGWTSSFEAVEAVVEGGEMRFIDEAGDEVALSPLATEFSDTIHHVHAGDATHPDGEQVDTPELGTAIVVEQAPTGQLMVGRVPAVQM
ncbi:MAG: hypothetical protein HRT94_02315 [Alphaproteobacteria bacterium]|nr:hypothetical protein [Alphaproteobacteria bacterium]